MSHGAPAPPCRGEYRANAQGLGLAKAFHDRADQAHLDEDAEEPERREQIARVRRVEAEAPRAEQRERRLVDRKRSPVEKVDGEEQPQVRAMAQVAERAPRRAGYRIHS